MPFLSKRRNRSSISKGSAESSKESKKELNVPPKPTRNNHTGTRNRSSGVLSDFPTRSRNTSSTTSPSSSKKQTDKSAHSGSMSKSSNSNRTRSTLPNAIYTQPGSLNVHVPPIDHSRTTLSTSLESSRDSGMSFGSSRGQDSFVNVSLTGLSIDNNTTINSHYSYDPYTGKHEEGNRNGRIKNTGGGGTRYLQTKRTSRHLPYLTANTTKTKALLNGPRQQHYPFNATKDHLDIISPVSTETSATYPCTPVSVDEDHNEFPEFETSQNVTPLFNVPLHPPPTDRPKSRRINQSHGHSRDEISSASSCYSNDDQKQMAKANKLKHAALAEREYWKKLLRSTVVKNGAESVETARVLFNLGGALLRCKDFEEALVTFKRTVSILGQHYSEDSLIVAKALDKIGLSATLSPSQENLDWALLALHEAFHIRYAQLGPHHCDVVDTLNNIAGVYLHKKRWENARDAYIDVLTVRVAIFGRNHPSVAITAQTLGKVFSHLSDFRNALNYMELALTVYREKPMALQNDHPLVGKTLKGIASIERLMDSLGKSDYNS